MSDLANLVRLEDPGFYLNNPYPIMQRLRKEEPVFYYEPLNMWVMSKYEDIRHVGRTPEIFSSHAGIHFNDFRYGDVTKAFFRPEAENLALIGPPRHNDLRSTVAPAFNPRIVAQMREQVRQICRDLLGSIEVGQTVNWSRQVAEPLPLMVIAILLGMPVSELEVIKYYSDEVIKIGLDLSQQEIEETVARLVPMYEYFDKLLVERDHNPTEDLLTTLRQAYKADLISADTVHMLLAGILTAGNETTRNTINGAIILLSEHPDQMKLLNEQPELVRNATEEFLRYVSPVRGFGRTVVEETAVRGQKLAVGQHVFNFFMSGNRDEDAFEEPEVFNLARQRKMPNLAFGIGQHFCIGASLARMEINVLFEELIGRFSKVALDGMPFRDKVLQYNAWENVQTVFR
jgi:cytochrome P450